MSTGPSQFGPLDSAGEDVKLRFADTNPPPRQTPPCSRREDIQHPGFSPLPMARRSPGERESAPPLAHRFNLLRCNGLRIGLRPARQVGRVRYPRPKQRRENLRSNGTRPALPHVPTCSGGQQRKVRRQQRILAKHRPQQKAGIPFPWTASGVHRIPGHRHRRVSEAQRADNSISCAPEQWMEIPASRLECIVKRTNRTFHYRPTKRAPMVPDAPSLNPETATPAPPAVRP